ncbi:MAG: ABC transporter substrate-binding protein [Thermoplasmatales archaeon]
MKKWQVAAIVVIVIVVAISTTAYVLTAHTSSAKANYVEVTYDLDGKNVTVKIPVPVKRVVSMDPSNTQMMFAIGAGNLVVADTSYDWWPSNATKLPKVEMDNGTASVEEVVAMNPDLVLAYGGIQPPQIIDQLENLSIPVLVFQPQNIQQIYQDMLVLGNVTGHESGAVKEVNSMKQQIQNVEAKISGYKRMSVLYMLWANPIYTAGPGSFINNILQVAGAINIASNLSSPYPTISIEQVIYDNPQAIIVDNDTPVTNMSYFTTGSQAILWENVTAIKTGKVLFFNVTESNWMDEPGPLTVNAVKTVAEFLYPQAF